MKKCAVEQDPGDTRRVTSPTSLTCLVVEPDTGMSAMLAEILAVYGLDGVICRSDGDAIKMLRSSDVRPDVVLCHAPTSGAKNALVGRIRENDRLRRVPVLCMSHSNGLSERAHAFEQGASEYLVRPLSPELLAERLRHWARRAHVSF